MATKEPGIPAHAREAHAGVSKQREVAAPCRHIERVEEINALEPGMRALPEQALAAKTRELRGRLRAGARLDDLLPEAFALVREAARRVLGMRHYDVQLVGTRSKYVTSLAELGICSCPSYASFISKIPCQSVESARHAGQNGAYVQCWVPLAALCIPWPNQACVFHAIYAYSCDVLLNHW